MEKQAYEGVIHTKDRVEGLQAFKEKRQPMYKGSKYVRSKQQTNSFEERVETIKQGGAPKYHEQNKAKGKLFVRDRLALLFDNGEYVEDALFANCEQNGLPADGVVTATGKIHGRTACVMANDSTVKAGSWGSRTVEKILRIQETAEKLRVPLFYLVDSAGARITDQVEMFPGRRGAEESL